MLTRIYLLYWFILLTSPLAHSADWEPVPGPIATRWAKEVTPTNVHAEYPRPQMVRKNWQNLNGLWDYAIVGKESLLPKKFQAKILVPFPIESSLSGVGKKVGEKNVLWYRRNFKLDSKLNGGRMLLHFGAVDWHCDVWVNGKMIGGHKGGYDPFTFDITKALKKSGPQTIVVRVWDPTNKGYQPRGKQVTKPQSIWYTSVTGIWQTVWLEQVPKTYIESLKFVPDVDKSQLRLTVKLNGPEKNSNLITTVTSKGKVVHRSILQAKDGKLIANLPIATENLKLWSPDDPHLYDLKIEVFGPLLSSKSILPPQDLVNSYFAMRKIKMKKDKQGLNRLFLNGKSLFQYGPLDQGWWPEGLYTAPTDSALKYDLEVTKKLGFNMVRKHVKVEPARWYYHCDKLGLLVWQDMPNGDRHISPTQPDIRRSAESTAQYKLELQRMIRSLENHPCIVMWVPFNEGWGQFDTDNILKWTKQLDPSRLVDGPSGWSDRGSGDVHDIHRYPGPAMPKVEDKRAVVLGEFGGLGLPIKGHLWQQKKNWGYRNLKSKQELTTGYLKLLTKLRPLIGKGLAAAIYTQTTDVEGEVNGLMTYDRKVIKMESKVIAPATAKLYLPPPMIKSKK